MDHHLFIHEHNKRTFLLLPVWAIMNNTAIDVHESVLCGVSFHLLWVNGVVVRFCIASSNEGEFLSLHILTDALLPIHCWFLSNPVFTWRLQNDGFSIQLPSMAPSWLWAFPVSGSLSTCLICPCHCSWFTVFYQFQVSNIVIQNFYRFYSHFKLL